MPAAAHTGAISFGLLYIPIKLYTAISQGGVSFNQLHRDSHARINYKKVRKDTGEEVKSEEIVRGYQYEKDKYIVLSDEELEQMKSPKDKAITITQFVPGGSINPLYYDKAYYVVPDGSNKPYYLLHEVMKHQKLIAIATTILGTKDTVMALSPGDNGLIAQTLFYQTEIKPMPVPMVGGADSISDAEMNMATMLVQSMTSEFKPEQYRDAYEDKLREVIQAKINGNEISSPQEKPGTVIDLMDALQRSLAQQQQGQVQQQQPRVH